MEPSSIDHLLVEARVCSRISCKLILSISTALLTLISHALPCCSCEYAWASWLSVPFLKLVPIPCELKSGYQLLVVEDLTSSVQGQ
jgi:hypothetical protein